MDVTECKRKGLIKKTKKDSGLIASLVEMSDIKEDAVREVTLTQKNIPAYASMAYDSLREVLEAVCVTHGYKVISHICLGELLQELLEDFNYATFDRARWIRNSINYYGKSVTLEQGDQLIEKIFALKKQMVKQL
ncbi:MAG: hypothetical protein OXR66_07910 [Candidatus Woesearchaeota archaeon]|nr:hypothetical protein [Candidatus Woesearchaeota archaeon]